MKKVAMIIGGTVLALSAGLANAGGEEIYKRVCFACHDTGAAGAPKLGDKAAWAPRIATGKAAMLAVVQAGKNAMPPRGTCADCSDADLAVAIDWMVSKSQ